MRQNSVGYQEVTIGPKEYRFFTVTFDAVGGTKDTLDIQEAVRVIDLTTGGELQTAGKIRFQYCDVDDPAASATSGAVGAQYMWKKNSGSPTVWGWYNGSDYVTGKSIGRAQCLVVFNSDSSKSFGLRFAGQVNTNPVSLLIPKNTYAYVGNMTPKTVDINNVIPYTIDGEFKTAGRLKIQFLKDGIPGANILSGQVGSEQFTWKQVSSVWGWYNGTDKCTYTLDPGEGFVLSHASSSPAAAVMLQFPNPVAK